MVSPLLALAAAALFGCARHEPEKTPSAPRVETQATTAPVVTAPSRPSDEQLLARVLAAGEFADAEARKRALAEILAPTTDEERAVLLESLWALGDARGARTRLAELFRLWCESDPAAAFASLGETAKGLPTFLTFLREWTRRDPMAALRWSMAPGHDDVNWIHSMADFVPDKGAFVRAVHTAGLDWSNVAYGDPLPEYVAAWHKENSAAALAWLDTLPPGEAKTALLTGAAREHAWSMDGSHLPSLVSLVERLPDGADWAQRLGGMVQEWGRKDPDAALRWAKENAARHPAASSAAIVGALGGVATLDAEAAKSYLEQLSGPDLKKQGERELAAGWATSDPKAAAAWLEERQPGWIADSWGEHGEHQLRLMAAWLDAEPETFIRRASAASDPESAEVTLANAAATIGHPKPIGLGRPERALELLTMMPDSQARRGSLATLTTNWLKSRERAQAEAAIRASSLPDGEKNRLLELAGVKP